MQMVCIDDLVTKDHLLRLIDRAIGIEKGAENHMSDEIRIQVLKQPERNPETDSFMWLLRSGED